MSEERQIDNYKIFEQQSKGSNFQEKYLKWEIFLGSNADSPKYTEYLEKFIQSYPFNHSHWIKLATQQLKKNKVNCLKIYQIGILKNPKSLNLWKSYLEWLKTQLTKSDPEFLKKQLQKAASTVGMHYKSKFIYQYLAQFQTDTLKYYELKKKALKLPLLGLEDYYIEFKKWMANLHAQQIKILCKIQKILQIEQTKQRQLLSLNLNKIYEASFIQLQKRLEFENKITLQQYKPFSSETIEVWKSYISYIRNSGKFQEVPFIYQRALISQCDNQHLWQQYFIYLQHDLGNTPRVLDILRNHSNFFRNMSSQLGFYWIQMQQRESPNKARDLLIEFQKKDPKLQTFIRHIQMQIRCKQFTNAKNLYDTLLTVFSSNVEIISYVVGQYAEFALKYFRDLEFSKKLLQNYFQAYPFNEYLFINYIQFYIKYVDLKQGNRQIFQQFMNIILKGLKKGKKTLGQKQYNRIKKVIKNYMRGYLITIYLIKTAQRKIKQAQIQIDNFSQNQQLKRNNEYKYEMVQTLSKRKKQMA